MENKKKPLILVTNDDGITAKGIRTLISIARELGDVVVVAPDSPQSAMGHAITINDTLYVKEFLQHDYDHKEYTTSGTPVDCVKMASHEILDRKPDLCLSGINHGSNSAINVIYSGTMSAAMEAGIEGIPAIGFSLCDYSHDADFASSREHIKQIIVQVLEKGMAKGVIFNVNIPKATKEEIKGVKICRQANAYWVEEFDKRTNPNGKDYYWLTGKFVNNDKGEDTDEWALAHNYISIVPTQYDLTAHHYISELNTWNFGN
ncbi:5'/3'-nucleotidase SurE [Nonlabens sp. Ci31]|jgi:5'-nucleotidase|uniref:5'/3'-nucleotidase SurE n=1 Tax=Nonlabens sp. Ci31 TaxID=2608253 RepID=UPI0014636591|nr:5'/3'-nucleotidase SurE [Nonlabens sp. Ci31]QJP33290.1 5'/3'-nucleotidase SurE [Nonlabens sp. Ci31]